MPRPPIVEVDEDDKGPGDKADPEEVFLVSRANGEE
jgi:hypothetical protein